MNVFIYVIIFIIGALIGSFTTLALYRIPKKIDIVKTHSFCPNCKKQLGFFELIPILSYIFLGGKCKHCKQKISPRYLIIEILSGTILVLLALALKINIETLYIPVMIEFAFLILYLIALFLIAGIDKSERKIEKGVLYYAIGVICLYIIYLCILGQTDIYRYVMYLVLLLALVMLDTMYLRKYAKDSYTVAICILIIIMAIYAGEFTTICTLIATILTVLFVLIFNKSKNSLNKNIKENKDISQDIDIGFFLCTIHIASIIIILFVNNWIM